MNREGAPAETNFFLAVNLVFISQVVTYGLAFLLRVVLARALGDDGLGTYSLFFITVLAATGLGSLGVGLGNIYFLNKSSPHREELMASSLFVFAATSSLFALLFLGGGLIFEPELFVSGKAYWLYPATTAALIAYLILTSFLHGESRFLALSVTASLQGVVSILIAAGLWASDSLDIFGAIVAWTAGFVAADLFALPLVGLSGWDLRSIMKPRWAVLKQQVGYGMQGQLSNLAQLFNYRLDQYLVAAFVTRAGVGHYTVAVGLAESIWWIASAVAMVLLPRLTQMEREQAEQMTAIICRNTLLISALAAIVLMAASPLVIRILFGQDFTPAVTPLLLLMPGILAASASRVLGSYLFSQGKAILTTYATGVALALTLVLDLSLIPFLEIKGAAIASSVAYTGSLVVSLYWYQRTAHDSAWNALIVRPQDRHIYLNLWRRLRSQQA